MQVMHDFLHDPLKISAGNSEMISICYKLLHMLVVYKGLHKTQKDFILDKRVTHLLNAKNICHIKSMRAQIRFDQWLHKLFKSLYFIALSMSRFQS